MFKADFSEIIKNCAFVFEGYLLNLFSRPWQQWTAGDSYARVLTTDLKGKSKRRGICEGERLKNFQNPN